MSTKVIVTVPLPNHQRARVTLIGLTEQHLWAPTADPVEVNQGDSREFLIHGSQSLEIDEIE